MIDWYTVMPLNRDGQSAVADSASASFCIGS